MVSVSFKIRPLTEADLPAVLAVYRACEDFLALGPVAQASIEMVKADMALSAGQGGRYCGIYLPGGALAGILDYIPEYRDGTFCIELLMLAAPFRRGGLGAAVVEWVIKEAGRRPLSAGVQVNNPLALRFWQRMGFAVTGPAEPQSDGTVAYPLRRDG